MSAGPIGRRAFLLALLATLSACATPDSPQVAALPPADPDPEPEDVYSPGGIPWANLTEEHKRRARLGLARLGESAPDDETLQARWLVMSPAQQRYMIRRPPPPPAPARTTRGRNRGGSSTRRTTTTPARRSSTRARTSTSTRQRRR